MNKVALMGRLVAAPELKQTQSGIAVCSFTLAIKRRFLKEGQQDTDFIRCVAWRSTAELLTKYFTKGSMTAVIGSIQTRSWDGADGKKQYATEVIVDEVYFTGSKDGGGAAKTDRQQSRQEKEYEAFGFSFSDIKDEDLPWA